MKLPTFEIFSGRFGDPDAVWIEVVEGLGQACVRMKAIAAEKPGPYFVFHLASRQVLASTDTTPSRHSQSEVA
jgi:hypothetical protein